MMLILQKGVNNMKDYIKQIYEEGLGKSIYVPLKKMIDKNTNGGSNDFFTKLIKIIYGIFALIVAFILFYIAYPFN